MSACNGRGRVLGAAAHMAWMGMGMGLLAAADGISPDRSAGAGQNRVAVRSVAGGLVVVVVSCFQLSCLLADLFF